MTVRAPLVVLVAIISGMLVVLRRAMTTESGAPAPCV